MYYDYPYDYYRVNPQKSFVRLLHASPDAPAVDIYANNQPIARNFSYRSFTPYVSLDPGMYNIKIYPAGGPKVNPVLDTNITIPPQKIITLAAVGTLENLSLLPVPDPMMPRDPKKVYIRFVHLSPDAPNLDISLPNGTKLFEDVQYKEITNYIPINPGTYTLEAKVAGTDNTAIYVPNIKLKPNRFYTVYGIGLANGSPSLQVLIPLDGNSYL